MSFKCLNIIKSVIIHISIRNTHYMCTCPDKIMRILVLCISHVTPAIAAMLSQSLKYFCLNIRIQMSVF